MAQRKKKAAAVAKRWALVIKRGLPGSRSRVGGQLRKSQRSQRCIRRNAAGAFAAPLKRAESRLSRGRRVPNRPLCGRGVAAPARRGARRLCARPRRAPRGPAARAEERGAWSWRHLRVTPASPGFATL